MYGEVSSRNPQTGGPSFVDSPWLFIQYVPCKLRTVLCNGDKAPV